jgi:hypothetical protein
MERNGKDAYNKQSRLQKEQYVYDQIMKNKDQFSKAELDHARDYMNNVRARAGLDPMPMDKMEGVDGDLFEDPASASKLSVTHYEGFGGDIVLSPDKTTTVIGKFNDSVNGHGTSDILNMPEGSFSRGGQNKGGINILDIPSAEYEGLLRDFGPDIGKEIFWQKYNQPFLENSFKNGDNIRLLSNPESAANRTGFYERELMEIEGYTDASGNKVPELAEKYGYDYNPTTNTYEKVNK